MLVLSVPTVPGDNSVLSNGSWLNNPTLTKALWYIFAFLATIVTFDIVKIFFRFKKEGKLIKKTEAPTQEANPPNQITEPPKETL